MGSAQDMSTSSVHYGGSGSKERTRVLTSETQIILLPIKSGDYFSN
jgi:hypothetical protein